MTLCIRCLCLGYCRKRAAKLVVDGELNNPDFIRDLRSYTSSLEVSCDQWQDYLADLYRDYPGQILDQHGREVFLDMEVFEVPNIRYWFRDWCNTPCPTNIVPRLRAEARTRVQVLATILRAHNPGAATTWGVRAANDNEPD
ncbi:hypothetical protein [Kordiimonas sp.]|uniref:hypothetical protein n=1 Tax=Kordiimonas sp. TaxID=1970157 RepID=UPI003A946A1B